MPPIGADRTLARHLKVIDWLKAELVGGVAALFKATALGSQDAIADALSSILLTTYVLGRRLGVSFAQLELRAALRARELAHGGHEVERTYGDLSALQKHFDEGAHG
ncbi:MAG: MazG-like family protein [Thermaerobacter sp.]|nr:MazG-like family protein [Thermaerobacter sp.]